jgi:hypothetical protein
MKETSPLLSGKQASLWNTRFARNKKHTRLRSSLMPEDASPDDYQYPVALFAKGVSRGHKLSAKRFALQKHPCSNCVEQSRRLSS